MEHKLAALPERIYPGQARPGVNTMREKGRSMGHLLYLALVACMLLGAVLVPAVGRPEPVEAAPVAPVKVLWDTSHGVYSKWEPTGGRYDTLRKLLADRGYELTVSSAGVTSIRGGLEQFDVLVLGVYQAWGYWVQHWASCLLGDREAWYSREPSPYSTEELEAIDAFVRNGGGLVVMGSQAHQYYTQVFLTPVFLDCLRSTTDHWFYACDNLDAVTQWFGVALKNESLTGPVTGKAHPLFEGVTSVLTAEGDTGCQPLKVSAPAQLVSSSGTPAVAVARDGEGKVVVVGDSYFATDEYMADKDYQNAQFVENIFDWVSSPDTLTEPEILSGTWTASGTHRARMAVDHNGMLHLVWHDPSSGYNEVYYRNKSSNGVWSEITKVTNVSGAEFPGEAVNPDIAVGPDGSVHVVWNSNLFEDGHYEAFYRSRSPDGVWTPPLDEEPLSLSPDAQGANPSVAVGADGTVHVAYGEYDPVDHIYYRYKPPGGEWSEAVDVSQIDPGNSRNAFLSAAEDGTLHIIWYDVDNGEVLYRSRSPDGEWAPALDQDAVNVSHNAGTSPADPLFDTEVDADGTLHVLWHDNDGGNVEIRYRSRSSDGTWSPSLDAPAVNVSGTAGGSYYPDGTVDEDGRLHVVWHDNEFGTNEILYRSRSPDGVWDPTPENLSQDSAGSTIPAIAAGSLHIVWLTETGGTYKLAYSMEGPYRPQINSPLDGAVIDNLVPTLEAAPFASPLPGATHLASQWQLTNVSGVYSDAYWDTLTNYTNLTSITVPEDMVEWGYTYYWHVRYQDNHGNWSSYSNQCSFVANRAPNTPSAVSPVSGEIVSVTPTLMGSPFSDDYSNTHIRSQWQISTDADDWSSPTWDSGGVSYLTSVLVPDGALSGGITYYWRLRYQDQYGEWSEYSAPASFFTDNVPPVLTIDALSPDPTGDDTPTLTGTVTDTYTRIVSVEYRVDGGEWIAAHFTPDPGDDKTGTYTFTIAALADGSHTVEVRATDMGNNVAADYATDTFVVDVTEPVVAASLGEIKTGDKTPMISGTITDTHSTIVALEYRVDGGTWQRAPFEADPENSNTWIYGFNTFLLPGEHTIELRATDESGNIITSNYTAVGLSISGPSKLPFILGGVFGGLLVLGLALKWAPVWVPEQVPVPGQAQVPG